MVEDHEERDITANRGRRCARLEPVSPSPPSEQAGASASAGVPVEFSSKGAPPAFRRCRRLAPLGASHCNEHSDPLVVTGGGSQAAQKTARALPIRDMQNDLRDGRHPAVKVIQGRGVMIPLEVKRGRPVKGIRDRERILVALVGYSATVRCTIGRDGVIRPKPRSWQRYRGGLAASVDGVNTTALAEVLGEKKDWVRDWRRKNRANSPMGTEVDSMPLTKADMTELREELEERYEALHADVRATLAVVLERFPDSNTVTAAVDEFLDGTLRD